MSNQNTVFLYDGPENYFITCRHSLSDEDPALRIKRFRKLLDELLAIGAEVTLTLSVSPAARLSKLTLSRNSAGVPNYGNLTKALLPHSAGVPNYGNWLNLPIARAVSLPTFKYKSPIKVIHSGEVPLRRRYFSHSRVFSRIQQTTQWADFPPPDISGYLPTQAVPRAVHLPYRPAEGFSRHDIPPRAA